MSARKIRPSPRTDTDLALMGRGPVDGWVAHRVRSRILNIGVSQKYVAEKLGCSALQFTRYLSGENRITLQRLYELGQILRISPAWFFEDCPDLPLFGTVSAADTISEHLTPPVIEMVRDFSALPTARRNVILELVKMLGKGEAS